MPNPESVRSPNTGPIVHTELDLSPKGLLRNYVYLGESRLYPSRYGRNLWKGIVTGYRPADEQGLPIIFDIAGGIAESHGDIVDMNDMPIENTYLVGSSKAYLRLEAEEHSSTLRAEIAGQQAMGADALDLAASLLQAGVQIPRPFDGKPFKNLEISIFSKMPYNWRVDQNEAGGITAYPIDFKS